MAQRAFIQSLRLHSMSVMSNKNNERRKNRVADGIGERVKNHSVYF